MQVADGKEILHDISLTVGDARLVVVTGPNGSGKSTLAKAIAGIMPASDGTILLDGADITADSIAARAAKGIAFAFQQPVRFKGLTVRDMLSTAAGRDLNERALCEYLYEVGLCARDYIDREMSASLSGGEIKRIEIAMAMARRAKLTIFDEPEAGIDIWSFNNLIGVFEKLRRGHRGSILIISHQERIFEIADEIVVLAEGRIRLQGPRAEVLPILLEGERCHLCQGGFGRE